MEMSENMRCVCSLIKIVSYECREDTMYNHIFESKVLFD